MYIKAIGTTGIDGQYAVMLQYLEWIRCKLIHKYISSNKHKNEKFVSNIYI